MHCGTCRRSHQVKKTKWLTAGKDGAKLVAEVEQRKVPRENSHDDAHGCVACVAEGGTVGRWNHLTAHTLSSFNVVPTRM